MNALADIILLLGQVFGLAAAPAAVTGAVMRNGGHPPRGFVRAFKLAYAPWLLAMAAYAGFQWYWVSILGRPSGEMPGLVMLGILVMGGYGAVYFIRAADGKL